MEHIKNGDRKNRTAVSPRLKCRNRMNWNNTELKEIEMEEEDS